MGSVMTAMDVMSFVIIGIILLVLANTMAMSARERTHEYAILKTVGFSGRHIFFLIAGESLLLSFLGSALGMLATFPAVAAFQEALPKGWFPVFYIEPRTIVLGCLAGVLVGLVASLIPARRAVSTRIVEGLRFVG
jgi:putative ABC transport system permease protein